jgi:hypothetical protein
VVRYTQLVPSNYDFVPGASSIQKGVSLNSNPPLVSSSLFHLILPIQREYARTMYWTITTIEHGLSRLYLNKLNQSRRPWDGARQLSFIMI